MKSLSLLWMPPVEHYVAAELHSTQFALPSRSLALPCKADRFQLGCSKRINKAVAPKARALNMLFLITAYQAKVRQDFAQTRNLAVFAVIFAITTLCPHPANPESLDSSIQSALSALFPPFEVTAPTVLSQLFRLIEERYSSDALQCLLDFLIPSKHLLESIQQAACAGYSDVVFRCEGWPLCLHDKTVIQLAPVNPLLLRPGDFYLQVEPFADQSVRIVLKSLLEEGCREVEETPILETSYPCMFTEEWLQELNEGRHVSGLFVEQREDVFTREADSLLQKAIKKVDERSKLDTSQVEQCIEEQKCSMKEVLEDTRLVMLQREGGAVLARMRREDFRFPQSEDYRDALESATVMYNQVEEKLHTLVMRSNESLQHLDFLFRLRKMESEISMVQFLTYAGDIGKTGTFF
ncbi:unnamed protein product [Tetraodon nigroviridis]|uniref:(spotted green pufferfish) hypothetical protein n=1 Tax=Tetraodon nigroviridis TaxID=99883 RepID=Q4RGV9_TETNG|nr:unnamed protein product [Tetraodon nigroviridis]